MSNLAILLTAYNRRIKTLSTLRSIYSQEDLKEKTQHIKIYLVDDGCADGTSQAVKENFPHVRLLQGTGNLYWNGGMHLAFGEALKENFNYYLWLNDDTRLFPNALSNMLETSNHLGNNAIIVGSTRDPDTGQLTYGGVRRSHRGRPLKFDPVLPGKVPVEVEAMNGNCVLIPDTVAHKVGNLDPVFTHGIGDYDYGLRARKLGYKVYLAPGYCGFCQRNPQANKILPFSKKYTQILSPHGLPPKEWAIFAKRYAGLLWPVYWISPYLHRLLD